MKLRSYLCGEWREGDGTPAVLVNPTTEEPLAEASTHGLDLSAALRFARDVGGPHLRALSFAERGAMLKRMSVALHEVRDALIEVSIANGGTTRSDAKFDIDGATGTLSYYAALGARLGERTFTVEGEGEQLTRSARFWGHHIDVPRVGAAVHVNAFNFPAWGLAEKAAVALLAGMPVVSKPATSTALLAYRVMERLVEAAALPPGALSLVCGGASDLLEHLGFQDVLAFTGSGGTAAQLRRLTAVIERSVRINVEGDSLNAAVLTPDVSAGDEVYMMFLRDVAKEITQKTGQKCTAIRRIMVPSALIDRVEEDLAAQLAEVRVGDPALADTRMGPVVNGAQLRDVRAGIDRLVSSGARIVHGHPTTVDVAGRTGDKGYFIGPVLLRADQPARASAVHEHEVFGPVATLIPYESADEAVGLIARGEGGLVCAVYGDDRESLKAIVLGVAPHHGRVLVGSRKVVDQATAPGMVLPSCVHGGPGRAGAGEELGGERGLGFYRQRTAVQGDRALLDKILA